MAGEKPEETVLSVERVSKDFALPHEKSASIKSSIINVFKGKDRTVEVQHALRDISFEIKKGEFFGILGRNGSGKSTLLRILAEIYRPTRGTVHKKGKLVSFIELGVGFNPELTGRENVYLNGALFGFSRREIDEKYDDIVAFAELEEFMDQKLKNYSSGMQVRLAFSVATRAEADILLVDEVLAVGDADFQRKCFTFFKSLKKKNTTVVFVTHDMNAVREYCDRAILINDGLITHEGGPVEVANEYLKLFNVSHEASATDTKDRWGNKMASFESVKAAVNEKTKEVEITAIITAHEPVEGLVAGVRVKNSAGLVVTGVNSEELGGLTLGKSETRTMTFRLANIFGNDIFKLDATLRLSDGVTICDNWENVASFSVLKNTKASYSVVPEVAVTVDGIA
jgi:ABC-2 type transport system ATP-binding protein